MSNPKPFLRALVLTLAGAGVAPVLGSTPDQLPAQLKRCASLTVASARLACYDALAGSSVSNQAAPPTAAASNAASGGIAEAGGIAASTAPPVQGASHVQGAVPAQPDMEFGVHNGALEAKLVNPHREKQMLAVVRNVSNRPRGELVVTLDNGQVWAQIEATRYPLKPGDHVEIDVGAMGSYVLWSPSNRRATKVTRIS
jgi:hypothetical protein